jgi:GT2 family glycosyltransferase
LNNDVEVVSDVPYCLQGLFTNRSLFGVAFDMLSGDTDLPYANRILPIWKQGLIAFDLNGKRDGVGPSFYGCGGGMAMSKAKYLALGGFDPIFQPFYWEDTDLSYRAWKRGWRIVFHPGCTVRHFPSSTIRTVVREQPRKEIIERNRLLFLWKNISDFEMLAGHVLWLSCHLLSAVKRGDSVLLRAFRGALKRLPQVMKARIREERFIVKKDREIFAIFANETHGRQSLGRLLE